MSYLIIGIGNPFRRDDGAGIAAAKKLAAMNLPGVTVKTNSGEGATLIDCWTGHERVLVIDAVRSGSEAGRIHRLDANRESIPIEFFHYSSHAFGLAEAVETARAINSLPKSLQVFGIEGKDFTAGEQLSDEIAASVELVVAEIAAMMKQESL